MRTKLLWKFFGALVFLVLLTILILTSLVSKQLGDHFEQKITQTEVRAIYQAVLVGAVAAIGLASIVAYFISMSITSPITELRRAAHRLAKGDLDNRIRVQHRDELGQLAESLNTMADELQARAEDQQRLNKTKTDFVANVSHELKTPLTLIKGYIETLEDKAMHDKAQASKFISIIREHADRLENIVYDLLSLGELESSKESITKSPTDLKKLVDDVALGFGHAITKKGHKLEIEAQGSDFTALVDSDKIEQVCVNLIDNAVKYTPDNGLIQIGLADHSDRVVLTVKDNGIGIDKEHIDRVFERFYRVDKARSREVGGTGLGLGIAKHIVLAHNGTIRIESAKGKGTTFSVSLSRK